MVGSDKNTNSLSDLDQALLKLRQDMNDPKSQSRFYDLFLNTTFCVPTLDSPDIIKDAQVEDGQVLPMIMESDGNDYLMLFDSEERLKGWSEKDVKWVGVPGYVLAATAAPPLHWALNVGTEYSKQFLPDEIAWLREVVEQCNAAAEKEEQGPAA